MFLYAVEVMVATTTTTWERSDNIHKENDNADDSDDAAGDDDTAEVRTTVT